MTDHALSLNPRQTALRPATVAALVAGAALVIKVVLILASGNTVPALLETGLYVVGVFAPVVVAVDVGRRRPSVPAKIAAGVGIIAAQLFYVTMLSDVVEGLVAPFTDTPYVLDEVPIAVLGAVWLIVGARLLRGRQ